MTTATIIEILGYLASGIAVILAARNGVKVPGLPDVQPAPVPVPAPKPGPALPDADKPAVDFLTWLIRVKAGEVKLDDHDREAIKLIRTGLDGVQ